MRSASYQQVLDNIIGSSGHDLLVTTITEGLINHTYKVNDRSTGESFILQQINDHVFAEPEKLVSNYELIWKQLSLLTIRIPEPLYFPGNGLLFVDDRENIWRRFEFIENGITLHTPANENQAGKVAETFAAITAGFDPTLVETIQPTIPGFHDLSLRHKQFLKAISIKNPERLMKAAALINELKNREHYVSFYDVITASTEFKTRLMHHDAKIPNILFDEETGQVICPVDLDTAMPGYFFSDLGDMIRSMACSDNETAEANDLHIRKDHYEAIVKGYLDVLKSLLTEAEKKYIHSAGLLMTYMQALRFLTDYLNGDIYYQTSYPEQNFDRASNQLTLLTNLESFLRDTYNFKI